MSTAFTSLAIATGFERDNGVLKRLGATPLSRSGLLVGKVLSLVFVIVQLAADRRRSALSWAPAAGLGALARRRPAGLLGVAAFASLALLLAGTCGPRRRWRRPTYLCRAAGGRRRGRPRLVVPRGDGRLRDPLPSGALAEGLRDALIGHAASTLGAVLVLAVLGAASPAFVTSRSFRWE